LKVVFSAKARADLRDIALYIAEDNPPAARRFSQRLRRQALKIGDAPRAYPLVPRHERSEIRRYPFRAYLVFYRIEDGRVAVLRIIHGSRDYERLLFPID
jgi:plasmid stabilization system protein ParE